jgi:hypothetical protein
LKLARRGLLDRSPSKGEVLSLLALSLPKGSKGELGPKDREGGRGWTLLLGSLSRRMPAASSLPGPGPVRLLLHITIIW